MKAICISAIVRPGAGTIKLFTAVINSILQREIECCYLFTVSHFHPSLMFVGKAGKTSGMHLRELHFMGRLHHCLLILGHSMILHTKIFSDICQTVKLGSIIFVVKKNHQTLHHWVVLLASYSGYRISLRILLLC
jgi:hypothetical protein